MAQRSTSTLTRLTGRPLLVARLLWAVVVIPALALLVYMIPVYYSTLARGGWYSEAATQMGISPAVQTWIPFTLSILQALVFVAVTLLMFWRKSDDRVAIFVSASLLLFGIYVSSQISQWALGDVASVFSAPILFYMGLGQGLVVVFLYTLPDGRLLPPVVRPLAAIWLIWSIAWGLFPAAPFSPLHWSREVSLVVYATAYGSTIVAQKYRQGHYYTPSQFQQVKWVMTGLAMALLGFLAISIPPTFFPSLVEPGVPGVLYFFSANAVGAIAFTAVPVTIFMSILRFRLWDLDFIVNRSLVYGVLTILLGGVFAAGFFGLRALLSAVFGSSQPAIALVVATAIVAGLFSPVRKRLRRLVDQYVYGIELDYEQALKGYAQRKQATVRMASDKVFGHYVGTELLGRGGMGEVYRGYEQDSQRQVAIKLMTEQRLANDEDRRRFSREAQAMSRLEHPNIVRLYEFGEKDGTPYMVMEYIDGPDLSTYLSDHGRLSLSDLWPVLEDVAAALDYAHQRGIVHRDIKPSNVLLAAGGSPGESRAVLMDFGIAKIAAAVTQITGTGLVGTLDYIAPEQIQGAAEVDSRADVYSLGVMVYELLTGELPFKRNNLGAMIMAHLIEPPPDPSSKVPGLPPAAAEAVKQAMAKKPEDRFATAGSMLMAMRGASVEAE
jgi:serine/threonine-protein kinase